MSEDRTEKTKNNLKKTLVSAMGEKPFEKITVTGICEKANVSRVTFYAYYNDKYELLDALIDDSRMTAENDFKKMQSEVNSENDAVKGFCNLFDSIMDMVEQRMDFFGHITMEENPDIYFYMYARIFHVIEQYAEERKNVLTPRYPLKLTASFIFNGMTGFIQTGRKSGYEHSDVRRDAKSLLLWMLHGELFSSRE